MASNHFLCFGRAVCLVLIVKKLKIGYLKNADSLQSQPMALSSRRWREAANTHRR
jgi:hypothetical protein